MYNDIGTSDVLLFVFCAPVNMYTLQESISTCVTLRYPGRACFYFCYILLLRTLWAFVQSPHIKCFVLSRHYLQASQKCAFLTVQSKPVGRNTWCVRDTHVNEPRVPTNTETNPCLPLLHYPLHTIAACQLQQKR